VSDFDPELYLRRLGERELASGLDVPHERMNGRAQLSEAAAALAVAGVVDPELAQRIATDYEIAFELRRGGTSMSARHRRLARAAQAPAPEALSARRVFLLNAAIPLPQGTLTAQTLTLTDTHTRLNGYVIWNAGPSRHSGSGPPDLRLDTPAGQTLTARFSGSWGDGRADGQFEADGTIAPDPAWVAIEGTRAEVVSTASRPAVRIERLEPARIYMRYLWALLADFGDRHSRGGGIEAAVAALIAAGLISAEDPELEGVLWIADGSSRHPRPRHLRGGPAPSAPASVPPAWRSLLARRSATDGPTGNLAVGALTPLFDGISVAVNTLGSSSERFWIRTDTTGIGHPHPMLSAAERRPVAWWASDDRDNHYLGHMNQWSGGNGLGSGEITFGPLDPKACELTLAVTTLTERALIPIHLDWSS
jgi:hypothetical protein